MLNFITPYIATIFFKNESKAVYNHDPKKIKLIMTLLVRNEEEILEQNIRFHCAMGVDGVIVTNHNSDDKTLHILEELKKEGLVLEIITRTAKAYRQKQWVNYMVKLARKKYNADWIINADADEFYFPDSLNLKQEIAKNPCANILTIHWTNSYPCLEGDYLSSPNFNADPCGQTKTIHQAKDFIGVSPGNHVVFLKKPVNVVISTVTIYHYHTRNYQGFEDKISRYAGMAKINASMRKATKLLEEGKLKDYFDQNYDKNKLAKALLNGSLKIDYSLPNFLKYKLNAL